MNSGNNQQHEFEIQKSNVAFGQGHLRMQTEPSPQILSQQNGNVNESANGNLYQMTFNSSKFRKEQQHPTSSSTQALPQQSQLSSNQFNFTGQNQPLPKGQHLNMANGHQQGTNNSGQSAGLQQNSSSSLQQQQAVSYNISSTQNALQLQSTSTSSNSQANLNSQKSSNRVRSNHSYLSGTHLSSNNQMEVSQSQSSSRFFQPAYELFFDIQRKLDKDLTERLKKQIPLDDKKEKILKYEAGNILSFIKIIFEGVISQNSDLKQQVIELQNVHKIMSASLSTTHHNTTNQSNGNLIQEENSVEITCKYCKEYEQQLQKLEAEIRNHIRTQYVIKQNAEVIQNRIEEVEKLNTQTTDKLTQITKEYEDIKIKLDERVKEMQMTQGQKQQLEKQIDQLAEKNKQLEQKVLSGKQSTQNLQINMSSINSQQLSTHQSFIKTKSVGTNKHILDSFVDDAGLLHEVDKSSSSKANFSSLSTAQQLQKSQEFQKLNTQSDSVKGIPSYNNFLMLNKNMGNEVGGYGENSIKTMQNMSSNGFTSNNELVSNENDMSPLQTTEKLQDKKLDRQSEELINIQKKLRKLQKISEKKLQNTTHSISQSNNQNQMQHTASDLSIQKQYTDRNGSTDKYHKPYQLSSTTQRVNTISNIVNGQRETYGNKQVDEKNPQNSSNQNIKAHNSSSNTLKSQPYQQMLATNTNIQNITSSSSTSQNSQNMYGTIRNVQHPNTNRPSSTLGSRDTGNVSNTSLNISKISCMNAPQSHQQNQQPSFNSNQSQKQLNKSSSVVNQNTSISSHNNNNQIQNQNRSKIPKHSNSGQQSFVGSSTINMSLNQTNNHQVQNQSHQINNQTMPNNNSNNTNNLNHTLNSGSSLLSQQQKSSTLAKQNSFNSTLNRTQSTSGTININNYINPQNNQQASSPQKIFSGRQNQQNVNHPETDRERNPSTGRQNTQSGVQSQTQQNNAQKSQNNQKSYEKLRAFMNSPKFKTDDDIQNNTRSQSMDGQSSYRNMNQPSTHRSKNSIPVQNYAKPVQKIHNHSTSNHYQINLSVNHNQQNVSQLNNSIHNRSHY